MKRFTKLGRTLLALTVLFILPLSDALSQNFIMETSGATYNATCGGVIKMKGTSSTFVNNGSNPLGTDEAHAVKGIVDWAATSATQSVKAYYYEKLFISGGANKTLPDGIFITGEACTSPIFTDYASLEDYPFAISTAQLGSTNDFTGTFTYLGDNVSVFPVTGDDAYLNLVLGNASTGNYTINNDDVVTVDGTIALTETSEMNVLGELNTTLASALDGEVTISGDGQFDVGTGLITFNGTLDLTGNGVLNGGAGGIEANDLVELDGANAIINVGAGNATFNDLTTITQGELAGSGTGDIFVGTGGTLALVGDYSKLTLVANDSLIITGAITNGGNGTNLAFDCSSDVTYNSATAGQFVLPTLDADGKRYGNLLLFGESKIGGTAVLAAYDPNINICNDFTLSVGGGTLAMNTNGGYLQMHDKDGLVTYGNGTGLDEVVGKFRRKLGTATTGTDYTFNNYQTALAFDVAPTSGNYFEFDVRRDQSPLQFEFTTDVDRKITLNYDLAGWTSTIQAGYLASEAPEVGDYPAGLDESDLKYFEANTTTIEKLAGTGYNNSPLSGSLRYVRMSGVEPGLLAQLDGTVDRQFASTHDLVMRANNTMYSIAAGRWSNPNTWDEGRIPDENDNAEVRNFVYVGIDAGEDGFAGTDGGLVDDVPESNRRSESNDYIFEAGDWKAAARTIKIASNIPGAALVIGNEDNADGYVFKTKLAAAGSFLNANTNNHTGGLQKADVYTNKEGIPGDITRNNINGLWLIDLTTGGKLPIFSTYELKNEGAINNTGIIEVGE